MIEAYGVKGMKSKPWQKTFKSVDALNAWAEKNDAEVYTMRQEESIARCVTGEPCSTRQGCHCKACKAASR